MSEYFQRIANDVLKASEELSAVMEDGIAAMLKGGATKQSQGASDNPAESGEFDMYEDIEEELMNSPLQGMTQSVLNNLIQNQVQPESTKEKLDAFRSAITWSEPFIMGLVVFHIIIFALCLRVSRPNVGLAPRLSLMVFVAVLVRTAEKLNAVAGQYWQEFATQNYFDRQGVFFAIMVSAPLLFDCLVMLMLFLREASQLLVSVKTNQLKRRKAAQNNTKGGSKTKKEQ